MYDNMKYEIYFMFDKYLHSYACPLNEKHVYSIYNVIFLLPICIFYKREKTSSICKQTIQTTSLHADVLEYYQIGCLQENGNS